MEDNLEQRGTNVSIPPADRAVLPLGIIVATLVLGVVWVYVSKSGFSNLALGQKVSRVSSEEIIPKKGVALPVVWGDLGSQMLEAGVIDKNKLEEIYKERGGLTEKDKKMVYGKNNDRLVIDSENSGLLLNLLWGLGLGNKNVVLDKGPMKDPRYGGAENFASTGGWVIAKGDPMDHYSKHSFVNLTKEQESLVIKVASGIYRPCCDNPTHFPDCNHGMAMLGLLELMASQGVSEEEMYKVALQVNSYWFPGHYATVASSLKSKDIDWKAVPAKEILGPNFSSASAAQQIASQIAPKPASGGGGCSV